MVLRSSRVTGGQRRECGGEMCETLEKLADLPASSTASPAVARAASASPGYASTCACPVRLPARHIKSWAASASATTSQFPAVAPAKSPQTTFDQASQIRHVRDWNPSPMESAMSRPASAAVRTARGSPTIIAAYACPARFWLMATGSFAARLKSIA